MEAPSPHGTTTSVYMRPLLLTGAVLASTLEALHLHCTHTAPRQACLRCTSRTLACWWSTQRHWDVEATQTLAASAKTTGNGLIIKVCINTLFTLR